MDRIKQRIAFWIGLVSLVLASGGCWQEVHYDPSKFAEKPQSQVQNPAEPPTKAEPEVAVIVDDESPVVASINEDSTQTEESPAEQAEEFDELFGEDTVAAETTESAEPTPVEPDATATETEVDPLRPSRTALAAWRMSSRWSLAAAIYAKGLGEEAYRGPLQDAAYAAELLHVELPALPEETDGHDPTTVVVDRLLQTGRTQIAEQMSEEYLPEYVSLSELAIKTHILLLVYTPKNTNLDAAIQAIRTAAEQSGLPSSLWNDLVDLLDARAPFAEVKQAVLDLHREVADYLADATP